MSFLRTRFLQVLQILLPLPLCKALIPELELAHEVLHCGSCYSWNFCSYLKSLCFIFVCCSFSKYPLLIGGLLPCSREMNPLFLQCQFTALSQPFLCCWRSRYVFSFFWGWCSFGFVHEYLVRRCIFCIYSFIMLIFTFSSGFIFVDECLFVYSRGGGAQWIRVAGAEIVATPPGQPLGSSARCGD